MRLFDENSKFMNPPLGRWITLEEFENDERLLQGKTVNCLAVVRIRNHSVVLSCSAKYKSYRLIFYLNGQYSQPIEASSILQVNDSIFNVNMNGEWLVEVR